jgi:acetylornithine/N-succinyldiaminopimelate aminotransferase
MDGMDWASRGRNAWMGGATRPDVAFVSGRGAWLTDSDGREYLDFVSGWAVCALGHAAPEVTAALQEQSRRLVHCSPGFWNPVAVELAERLQALTGMDRVFLGTTGAEANECAIKLARKWGVRNKAGAFRVVSTWKGFHGRTLATMAATGKPEWHGLFGPACEGFAHVEHGDLAALESALGADVCAVLLEPVQGEGGVVAAAPRYWQGVRELCDHHGVLLIADEVQTGLGRCGAWLASDALGARPDIVTLGKGLGGGVPVSACATRAELDLFEPGDQGGTFTYHPLGAAVALAVLRAVEERDLPRAARERGEQVGRILSDLAVRHGLRDLRGMGLLRAFDLPQARAADLVAVARERGLLLNAPKPSTIRICPALTVSETEVEEFGRRLEASLAAL